MPEIAIEPGVAIFYRDDDFTDPWHRPEAVLLLHGLAESSVAWNGWMPALARRFRAIRPDMRGFGMSTPMPVDHRWSTDRLALDFVTLMDRLGIERFHLVGSKVGAGIALRIAAAHPRRIATLTVIGARLIGGKPPFDGRIGEEQAEVERDGIASWAKRSMGWRLGSAATAEMRAGWLELMARTPQSTLVGFLRDIPNTNFTADVLRLASPTLVIVTEGCGDGEVSAARAVQGAIPNSELVVLRGDSNHAAATDPEACALATLDFIERYG